MLKALELAGFKSFADKTRFEFPRGITVVVGPNGSGKSNVVDAIKWVLGEQSVKSLRGKEMTDVIFNGSAARRPLNCAEVTLTFDNTDRRFTLDTPEIQVTRRVYRSGEAEYLLNRQACRLRDIKDLFSGTGVATEAYSVIEQGKVDVLLQASPKDRRMIFEEAAGISRFKTKKIESLRRLERVEQNLLRLSDIVEEVESRLKSVRMQAAKAQHYKELSDRLQALRMQVGRADLGVFGQRLAELEGEAAALVAEIAGAAAQAERMEAEALEHDVALATVEEDLRTHDSQLHENRQRIAVLESTVEHERTRCVDLGEEVDRHRRQTTALNVRAVDLQQLVAQTDGDLATAEGTHREIGVRLADGQRALTELTGQIDRQRNESGLRRADLKQRQQAVATITAEIGNLESQAAAAQAMRQRDEQRLAELHGSRQFIRNEVERLKLRQAELAAVWEDFSRRQQASQQRLSELRQQLTEQQRELNHWRELQAGTVERLRVLEELERRLEGVNTGVKELLVRAKSVATGPLKAIRGLVADLIRVPVEIAPLIEIALGERAQYIVIDTARDMQAVLVSEGPRLSGRVAFMRLDAETDAGGEVLTGQPGVLARADQLVEVDSTFRSIAERLLGHTWIVDQISQAWPLAGKLGPGAQFVSRAGELLTSDGVLHAGPRNSASGLISRRSELRALKQQIGELEQRVRDHDSAATELTQQIATQDAELQPLASEHHAATAALAEQRQQVKAAEERQTQLAEQVAAVEAEAKQAAAQVEAFRNQIDAAKQRLTSESAGLDDLQAALERDARQAEELERRRQQLLRQTTADQVQLAKSEQRLDDLQSRRRQYRKDQQERQHAISDSQRQLEQSVSRRSQAERAILSAESELADLYLRKEEGVQAGTQLLATRELHREQRQALTQESQRIRNRIRRTEEKLHKKELAAGEVRHERNTLVERLREDYGIDVAAWEGTPPAEISASERAEVEREIADLRQKLNQIGGVNLDSLAELEELEQRFQHLSGQFQDLSSAKASLEQIIHKINADSRRLFAETLETVKGHFQNLFRKLFGGGHADVVLEEGVDILESGIEIVARPPGKELRNISLMSGGEKTLTCVALLLAIFRSRPSPFCVLDEVDAALDEANIGRFMEVLREFLGWTQFVVVTHSKKTMTCASTLYGVTMQESGISKRVSVRFEDVSDTGEILVTPSSDSDDTQAA